MAVPFEQFCILIHIYYLRVAFHVTRYEIANFRNRQIKLKTFSPVKIESDCRGQIKLKTFSPVEIESDCRGQIELKTFSPVE